MAIRYEYEGDDEQSLRYYRLAADKGSTEAQVRLALRLENYFDRDAPENREAFKWMMAAAKQDDPKANYCLGNFYRDGTGVEVDEAKAFEHYTRAADLGNVEALERLGLCHANGVGTAVNDDAAFRYFICAAERGDPKAQCNLGLCYLNGLGCSQDTGLGFRWISQAIASGQPIVLQMLQDVGLEGKF